jgi:hypothetical protein
MDKKRVRNAMASPPRVAPITAKSQKGKPAAQIPPRSLPKTASRTTKKPRGDTMLRNLDCGSAALFAKAQRAYRRPECDPSPNRASARHAQEDDSNS